MEVVIDQKGEETVIKIKGRVGYEYGSRMRGKGFAGMGESGSKSMCRLF